MYDALVEAVIKGEPSIVEAEVNRALDGGGKPDDILANGLIGAMNIVGKRMGSGEMFLPEVLASTRAMHKGIDIVKPLFDKSDNATLGTIVIGTVEGDIHDIGKTIVGSLLEGGGFKVIDIGVDVPNEAFAQAVEEHNPDVLGMSALLTTTIPNMGKIIELLKEKRLRDKVKIIVGGASVTEQFAQSIGADGYAEEAGSAVEVVKQLLSS